MKPILPWRGPLVAIVFFGLFGCQDQSQQPLSADAPGSTTSGAEPIGKPRMYDVELVYIAPDGRQQSIAMDDPHVAEVRMLVTEQPGKTIQCILQHVATGQADQFQFSYTIGSVTRSKTFGYAGSQIEIQQDEADQYAGRFVVRGK